MHCYCCNSQIQLARKVKLRVWRDYDPAQGGPDSAAYKAYAEETTYRWAVVCCDCYRRIDDDPAGLAEIGGRPFNLAAASRGDKAPTIDQAGYQDFQRREAAKLGLDI